MTHRNTVTLETERLILRRFTLDDADAMFRNWCNDPEVTKFLMWQTHKNVEETRQIREEWVSAYEQPDNYQWAIVPKDFGEPIGSIAVVHKNDEAKMVQIGYCIGKAWWHLGYTSEALTELVRFFFENVGVNRIESRHDPRNPNSGKVMLKAGLKFEGTLRQSDMNNQGVCDAVYYAILAEDYFGKTQPEPKGYIMDLRKIVGHRPLIQVGASIIVDNGEGDILLKLLKDNGEWDCPSGSMDLGESLDETAKRELLEETGLTALKLVSCKA
jgi:ribosomal-protein-alanine N-acetyltransferase